MPFTESELQQIINLVVTNTINVLEERKLIVPKSEEKSAYQKTESLLYSYNGFKKIIKEREQEIDDLRRYGIPQNTGVKEYVDKGGTVSGIVLEEERVEDAVWRVRCAVEGTVQVVALIDKCMAALKNDSYYDVLEMRYFEGRTLEDIGVRFGKDAGTISRNKSRLVKELAMRLFPDQCINEMMK